MPRRNARPGNNGASYKWMGHLADQDQSSGLMLSGRGRVFSLFRPAESIFPLFVGRQNTIISSLSLPRGGLR